MFQHFQIHIKLFTKQKKKYCFKGSNALDTKTQHGMCTKISTAEKVPYLFTTRKMVSDWLYYTKLIKRDPWHKNFWGNWDSPKWERRKNNHIILVMELEQTQVCYQPIRLLNYKIYCTRTEIKVHLWRESLRTGTRQKFPEMKPM